MDIEEQIKYDLSLSGLKVPDLRARTLEMAERAACGIAPSVEGYVIPYFNLAGKPLPFYRVKLFANELKYKQLKSTSNHVYFPPGLLNVLNTPVISNPHPAKPNYIIITEGEKKAAAAVKAGFPAVAFGGVDSWRNKILLLPKETEFSSYSYNKELVGAKLPSSMWETPGVTTEPVAVGFDELANYIKDNKLVALIIYDSDETTALAGMKPEVQRAAAELGFEFRRRGIPITHIRQLILPCLEDVGKTGLDDFLKVLEDGVDRLKKLIRTTLKKRSAFPTHPNMEADLNKKLQSTKLSRKDMQKLSLSLITDLDSRGIRMYSENEQQLYYFEEQTSKLLKIDLATSNDRMQTTPFTKLLYRYYGISAAADIRLVKWLTTQFGAEEPIEAVDPFRVLARPSSDINLDVIRYQVSDGFYAKVTGDKDNPIEMLHNGAENILFEAGHVESMDPQKILAEFEKRQNEPLEMWWEDVLHEVRLKNHGKTASLLSLLYYVSPWLFRWRGTQLPAELIIGEAGSGKSTLCELRLNILTGYPNLRNAPSDLKDWHASVVNSGALHITDNVQLLDKSLKQRLSDEICRLITEPHPHIEQRKYYTNSDLVRMRVDTVFAFTAITQPFQNSDILQRSVIMELDKLSKDSSTTDADKQDFVSYDSTWKQRQIDNFGGREAWVAHHLYVLHRFLALAQKKWKKDYQAKHRLINLEQCLVLMAELFKLDGRWIPDFLSNQVGDSVVDADWTLEGIVEFCNEVALLQKEPEPLQALLDFGSELDAEKNLTKLYLFTAATISNWAAKHPSFMECANLINPRKLGRYMQTHKAMVAQMSGLQEGKKINNRVTYLVTRLTPSPSDD